MQGVSENLFPTCPGPRIHMGVAFLPVLGMLPWQPPMGQVAFFTVLGGFVY